MINDSRGVWVFAVLVAGCSFEGSTSAQGPDSGVPEDAVPVGRCDGWVPLDGAVDACGDSFGTPVALNLDTDAVLFTDSGELALSGFPMAGGLPGALLSVAVDPALRVVNLTSLRLGASSPSKAPQRCCCSCTAMSRSRAGSTPRRSRP
jgi:hypothetical protein